MMILSLYSAIKFPHVRSSLVFTIFCDFAKLSQSKEGIKCIFQDQHINIIYNTTTNTKTISEILILHVENGADTFITFDITFDKGPFGLSLDDFPVTLYDNEKKKYIYSCVYIKYNLIFFFPSA